MTADPQVGASIKAVGTSFGLMLKAVTPGIPGMIGGIADGIKRIADSVAAHPQLLATFVTFLSKVAAISLNVIAGLSNTAAWIERNWHWFKWVVDPVDQSIIWIVQHWGDFQHRTAVIFDGIRHDIAHIWDQLWNNTVVRTNNGINAVMLWVGGLPGKIMGVFRGAGTWLVQAGKDILGGLFDGLRIAAGPVLDLIGLIRGALSSLGSIAIPSGLAAAATGALGGTLPLPTRRGFALGTASAAPGWAWVGERGAELVHFGGGEQVIPLRGYAGGTGGGTGRLEALLGDVIGAVQENTDVITAAIGTLTGVTAQAPAAMGAALSMGSRSAVYSALYS